MAITLLRTLEEARLVSKNGVHNSYDVMIYNNNTPTRLLFFRLTHISLSKSNLSNKMGEITICNANLLVYTSIVTK